VIHQFDFLCRSCSVNILAKNIDKEFDRKYQQREYQQREYINRETKIEVLCKYINIFFIDTSIKKNGRCYCYCY